MAANEPLIYTTFHVVHVSYWDNSGAVNLWCVVTTSSSHFLCLSSYLDVLDVLSLMSRLIGGVKKHSFPDSVDRCWSEEEQIGLW